MIRIFDIDIFNEIYIFLFNEIYIKFFVNGNIYDLFDNRAKQQCGFFISRRSTLNTQSVHKASKSIIVEIHPSNTILLGNRPSIAILSSEVCKVTQI